MNLGSGIVLDIIVVAILLFSTICGMRKGLVMTVVSFMQWFVCVIFGFIFCERVKVYLIDHTALDDTLTESIARSAENSIESNAAYQAMPDLFGGWIDQQSGSFIYGTAASVASALLSVIAFLLIVFGIKLLCFFFARLFSRKYNDGAAGFLDGFLGFLFGAVRGIILVFLFFALLIPVTGLLWPELSQPVAEAMDKSSMSKVLYDDNVLLILLRDLSQL